MAPAGCVQQKIIEALFETIDMPILELNFRDKPLGNYPLQKGSFSDHRPAEKNNIVIDNLAVSSHHAKIDSVGDGFVLIDLQSKNGSFVNEKQVGSHWLKQGDIINIGKHSLVFCYSEEEDVPEDESDEIEKTMVMDTSKYRSMVNKSTPEPSTPKDVSAKKNDTIAVL